MPYLMNEKLDGPEPGRHSRHSRFYASAPIAIPARKSSPNAQGDAGFSPDLMFDMSPISPTYPPPPTSYPSTSRPHSNESNQGDSFMYQVPILRTSPKGAASQLRHKRSTHSVMPFRNESFVALRAAGTDLVDARNSESYVSGSSEAAYIVAPSKEHIGTGKTLTTTKITGFAPINEHQPPINEKPHRPTIPLHPLPRRSSHSSSAWIHPGKGQVPEDAISYSQADPSIFEFQRHLLRRIENQDPSRFKSPYPQYA